MPDLATPLDNQSATLRGLGRHENVLSRIDEALCLVLPLLERAHCFLPDAGLRLLQTYLERSKEAGCDPDADTTVRMYAVLLLAADS